MNDEKKNKKRELKREMPGWIIKAIRGNSWKRRDFTLLYSLSNVDDGKENFNKGNKRKGDEEGK